MNMVISSEVMTMVSPGMGLVTGIKNKGTSQFVNHQFLDLVSRFKAYSVFENTCVMCTLYYM